jgi:hypothetical protein
MLGQYFISMTSGGLFDVDICFVFIINRVFAIKMREATDLQQKENAYVGLRG